MEAPSQKPPSILILLTTFLVLTNIPTAFCADDLQFLNCTQSLTCGNLIDVKYPFWGVNRADYCGLPGFELECQEDVLKLTMESITYRILNVNPSERSLTVARDDYWATLCPALYKNTTINSTLFSYAPGLINLTLYYGCTRSSSITGILGPVQCDIDDDNSISVFVLQQDAGISPQVGGCSESVIVTVFQDSFSNTEDNLEVNASRIGDVIDAGFGLRWSVNNNECDMCVRSGGACGCDLSNGQFTCFCSDEPKSTSCSSGSSSSPSGLSSKRHKLFIPIGFLIVAILIISIVYIVKRMKKSSKFKEGTTSRTRNTVHDQSVEEFMKRNTSFGPKRYSYLDVKRMTKSFTEKVGQGGYGAVYKGNLLDGRFIAVKVINESKGSGEEFINEVACISRTSHVNVVTLLGYCYEKNQRILIYEFMPNGSLDKFIFQRGSSNASCNLEWKTMYNIAVGIARGLAYLHRGCNTQILHFDIKPQNILLDEDFCPKISDFGLAKICKKKESIVSMLGTRGTAGYIAPEVLSRMFGGVSHKSDVYSYGMLVLETIGAKKNFDSGTYQTSEKYFPDWIYEDLEQGMASISSSTITEEENQLARKMTLVSLWCIQMNPPDRPSMNNVVEMLEGNLQSLPIPPKPRLYSIAGSTTHFSSLSSSDLQEN